MNELLRNKLMQEIKRTSKVAEQPINRPAINEEENQEKSTKEPKLYTLSSKTTKILNDKVGAEYIAHYYYSAAKDWCNDKNYKKAAKFFEEESQAELEHANKIEKYMTDFNVLPTIPTVKPNHSFNSLAEIIYGAYSMELALMKSYNQDSIELFSEDITTFDFLTKLRKIQKDAVVEYNDLINGLELIDKNDKFQVLYFEQTYF